MTYIEASNRLGDLQVRLNNGENCFTILKEMNEVLDKVIQLPHHDDIDWVNSQPQYDA